MADMKAIVADVRAGLDHVKSACGPYDHATYAEWYRRRDAEVAVLTARLEANHDARISKTFGAARVRIGGVASSCTAGIPGALENWITAAEKRLNAGAA